MKTSISILILFLASIGIYAQDQKEVKNVSAGAGISWQSATTYDFGNIKKGLPVTSTFEFINNGSEPLIISEAKGSCGCTSVEYSQQPIAPGAKGFVKATFNASAVGVFGKSVTVTTNATNKTAMLYIKGQVIE